MPLVAEAAAKAEPKGARITLRAKWQGTPLLHEAAEFLVGARPAAPPPPPAAAHGTHATKRRRAPPPLPPPGR